MEIDTNHRASKTCSIQFMSVFVTKFVFKVELLVDCLVYEMRFMK